MAGLRTAPVLTTDPSERAIVVHFMDASGDQWTERLVVALTATLTAINAWISLYQAVTQASIFDVTEERTWDGDADPDNANSNQRSGIENGINLMLKEPALNITESVRVIAPIPEVFQGNQDIPLLSQDDMEAFIVATLALRAGYNFRQAQYTTRRERKNNPRVK